MTNADYVILHTFPIDENVHLNIDLFLGIIAEVTVIIDMYFLW